MYSIIKPHFFLPQTYQSLHHWHFLSPVTSLCNWFKEKTQYASSDWTSAFKFKLTIIFIKCIWYIYVGMSLFYIYIGLEKVHTRLKKVNTVMLYFDSCKKNGSIISNQLRYSHSHSINKDCSQYQSHGNWSDKCYQNDLFLLIWNNTNLVLSTTCNKIQGETLKTSFLIFLKENFITNIMIYTLLLSTFIIIIVLSENQSI